jgi:hypothetical protein
MPVTCWSTRSRFGSVWHREIEILSEQNDSGAIGIVVEAIELLCNSSTINQRRLNRYAKTVFVGRNVAAATMLAGAHCIVIDKSFLETYRTEAKFSICVAGILVHEITHARLEKSAPSAERTREELVCNAAARRFLRSVCGPDSANDFERFFPANYQAPSMKVKLKRAWHLMKLVWKE